MLTFATLDGLLNSGVALGALGSYALAVLGAVIFVESGVLFPFLPGDSLLITAAVLRDELHLSVWAILAVTTIAAVAGDQVGFYLGHKFGRRLFNDDARILRTDRLTQAEEFFAKHGPLALVLGRFVPIVRTYVPFAAGTARMRYPNFAVWNVSGAVAWVFSMVLTGVFLGNIPGLAHSINLVMIVVVFVSALPVVIGWLMKRRERAQVV